MGNGFVGYLNSMNNANANNQNALAESQILNDYYHEIKIEREIGEEICRQLFDSEPKAVILTGHAGDGKTGLLSQILGQIGYFENGKTPLKQFEVYEGRKKLFYVKDMSELGEDEQEESLKKFLEAPLKGIPAILIGNTGPLLNTFKRLIDDSKNEKFEADFLDALDMDYKEAYKFGEYKFDLINIAKIDNTYFSSSIIRNILKDTLWEGCIKCNKNNNCPVYSNIMMIKNQKDKVMDMLEKIYFYLTEKGTRLTIRQIISHLSYSITGNLTCEEINKFVENNSENLFDYAFPNLFFGFIGTKKDVESNNIKAIRELEKLNFDKKAFVKSDNIFFVKEDFSTFEKNATAILEKKLESSLIVLDEYNTENIKIRQAFRRFAILLNENDIIENEISEVIFGTFYEVYFNIIKKSEVSRREKKKIIDVVFNGMYKLFLGVAPKENTEIIYITLKRSFNQQQNVQLSLGEFSKNNIEIKVEKIKNEKIKESFRKANLILKIGDVEFELNHEILNYLYQIAEGIIFTSYNPNFTFGISNLKSKLIKTYKYEDDELVLLCIKNDKVEKIKMYFEKRNNKEILVVED